MQPLVQPNWHIALIHFPIALIVIGTIVELFSFLGWRRTGFRWAGRWMLLIGAILSVPTTFSGLYALSQEVPNGVHALAASDPLLAKTLRLHIWTQSIATGLAMFLVVVWISLTNFWRDRLSIVFKLLLIVTSGLILYGSHLGGSMVYQHQLATTQPAVTLSHAATEPAFPPMDQLKSLNTWAALAPPDQTHVTMAGFAMALACVTLGLAIRAAVHYPEDELVYDPTHRIVAAFAEPMVADPVIGRPTTVVISHNHTSLVGVSRFWLLTLLLMLITAVLGLWIITQDLQSFDYHAIWSQIKDPIDPTDPKFTRRLAHLIAGAMIIVDTLILAIIARVGRRNTVLLLVFATPLVLALAAQIWLGVLLLLDGPMGTVTHFNP